MLCEGKDIKCYLRKLVYKALKIFNHFLENQGTAVFHLLNNCGTQAIQVTVLACILLHTDFLWSHL